MKPIKKHYIAYYLLFILLLSAGCKQKQNISPCISCEQEEDQPELVVPLPTQPKHAMIVFVHGTFFTRFPFRSSKAVKIGRLIKGNQFDKKSLYNMCCMPMSDLGFHAIDSHHATDATLSDFNTIAAQLLQDVWGTVAPGKYEKYHFYTFGWDGYLKASRRRRAGEQLYNNIYNTVDGICAEKGIGRNQVDIIVISHSHGGNVALQMATAHKKTNHKMVIDSLVLLGMPVQSETADHISSSLFKNIFNLYSHGDWIQRMDVFSTHDIYSRRRFKTTRDKVNQLALSVNDMLPTHAELWMFNGKSNFYNRSSIKIDPFPVAAFVPCIIEMLKTDTTKRYHQLSIDVCPDAYHIKCTNHETLDARKVTLYKKLFEPYVKLIKVT